MRSTKIKIEKGKICDPSVYIDAVKELCPTFDFVSYEECKKWVRKNKIKTMIEFRKIKKPDYIPTNPHRIYKNNGWIDGASFLGIENCKSKVFLSYKECQKWVLKNKIKTREEYCKIKKPNNVPYAPNSIYKNNGWSCWPDFLKNSNYTNRKWTTFEECKRWVMKNKIKTQEEYFKANRPINIPIAVHIIYKNKGWKNWGDFLGNGNLHKKDFVSYKKCCQWARINKIKSQNEYKISKRPQNIPYQPYRTYKNSGWTNWYDFLGKKK